MHANDNNPPVNEMELAIDMLDDALCIAEVKGVKLAATGAAGLLPGIGDFGAAASALRGVADLLERYQASLGKEVA